LQKHVKKGTKYGVFSLLFMIREQTLSTYIFIVLI